MVLNACVGGVQKFRTEQRIRDLSTVIRRQATVHRDGKIMQVDATNLVPGDIVVLTSGEMVPADCRILHAEAVEASPANRCRCSATRNRVSSRRWPTAAR